MRRTVPTSPLWASRRRLDDLLEPPEPTHLLAALEQVGQRTGVDQAAVPEHDHLVGPLERRSRVGDGQHGAPAVPEDALPERGLGVDVERAGEVVAHEELRRPQEHAGCSRALDLTAREPDAAGPDGSVDTL